MAKPLDSKEIVTTDEVVVSDMPEMSALIELLNDQGIITNQELIEKSEKLKGKIRGD
jgi:hypothetical protein